MGRNAFDPVLVVDKLQVKIECLEVWENSVLIGTDQGQVLRFQVDTTGDPGRPILVALKEFQKTFSRKPITQLQVIDRLGALVSMADGCLTMHELPSFKLKVKLERTKGGHLFALDDSPQRGCFVCVAVKRKLLVYQLDSGRFVERKEISLPDTPKTLVWCNQNLCVGFKTHYSLVNAASGASNELFRTGRNGVPSATILNDDQILLGRDSLSVFIGFDGKPRRKLGLSWTDVPMGLGLDFPYLVAVLPKFVEVRSIFQNEGGVVQICHMKGMKMISAKKGCIYVGNQREVWRLMPVPMKDQVSQLIRDKEYEEAINLLENMATETPREKMDMEKQLGQVRILYAYHLFWQGYYDKAMDNFIALDVDPLEVIGLYPNMLPRDLRERYRNDSMPELVGSSLEKALEALVTYLTHVRVRLPKGAAPPIPIDYAQVTHLPTIVDTSLLKAYVNSQPTLAASLLRIENYCHIKASETVLKYHKKFDALVLLYRSKNMNRQALEMLEKSGRQKNDPSEMIKYLKTVDGDDISLIIEYSKWPLQQSPDDALQIFTELRSEENALPPDKVLNHLKPIAPELVVPYLEWLVYETKDKRAEFHNELIYQYLDTVIALQQTSSRSGKRMKAGTEPGLLGVTRKRLLSFLSDSTHYHAAKMLSRFPEDLFEERAVLLSRIQQHEQALKIYAHDLGDFKAAEEYCAKHYDEKATNDEARDVYLSLLKTYLRPPAGMKAMWTPALDLLNKHFNEINAAKALQLLPNDMPISKMESFLQNVLRNTEDRHRNYQVLRSLLKAENLQVREKLIAQTTACIKIDEDTMCPVCNKRLGTSAFACYPNGRVVHYACRKSNNVCPVTGTVFTASSGDMD